MKVLEIHSENFKKLKIFHFKPTTDTVVVGGVNSSGKTSALESIAAAIAGADAIPDKPIRKGQPKAEIILDLGEITVTRKFTQAGSTLIVKARDGSTLPSPQAVLDKLTSKLTFDPLSFVRMKPIEQRQSLQTLVGLDFTALDQKRAKLYEDRTLKNREVTNQEARLKGIVVPENAPDDPISIEALAQELKEANKTNVENASVAARLQTARNALTLRDSAIYELKTQIEKLQKELDAANIVRAKIADDTAALEKVVAGLKNIDTAAIVAQIQSAQATNSAVAAKKQKAKEQDNLLALQTQSHVLTRAIDQIDNEKQEKLANTKFPVPGLSFDETGVLYNGLPFDQASGAEQLRVSVAMGLALNPKLKVLLIRDGSLLDENSMKIIREMVTAQDAQCWLERVSQGAECSVILEDGEIKEQKAEEPETLLV